MTIGPAKRAVPPHICKIPCCVPWRLGPSTFAYIVVLVILSIGNAIPIINT